MKYFYLIVNNQQKKVSFLLVLFFAYLAHAELNVFFMVIPNFYQLTLSEGKVKITSNTIRTGEIHTLFIDKQKIPFDCGLPGIYRMDCVPNSQIKNFQGKCGKVWWYKINEGEKLISIYQLEVNGNLEILYEKQKERYQSLKKRYFYPYTILFIISLCFFVILQLANNSVLKQMNEK